MNKLVFLVLVLIFLVSCTEQIKELEEVQQTEEMKETDIEEFPSLKELEKVEIKEYKGKELDAMADVKDVSIKGPQYVDKDTYRLEVFGLVNNPKNFTYEEVIELQKYSKVVDINCVLGWDATVLWEGILLSDLFEEVQPTKEVNTVIFYAADDYTTSLPLDQIIDNNLLMADKINNVTLIPERGFPFQLVAESKLGYKWIKWITKIELSDDEDYKGYWESRGYSNKADLDGTYTD